MSRPPLTAGQTAEADQLSAGAKDEVARLAKAIRLGDARSGEAQNLADFISYLSREHPPQYLAALFVVAVRQVPAPGDGETP